MRVANPQDVPQQRDAALADAVREALRDVYDPEIPTLSVVDLGMVHDVDCMGGEAHIRMTPTFVGCPALRIIEKNVKQCVLEVEGVTAANVEFVFDTAWTTENITEAGREKLREFGISPPKCTLYAMKTLEADCPYCGSANTRLENLFGPTACRSLFYCDDCKQPFETMKPV